MSGIRAISTVTSGRTCSESSGSGARSQGGVALLAVLFALTLLMLLALPFGVSMSAGADAAARELDAARAEQSSASVRDLLLADAALSHPTFDATPEYDSQIEWPDQVVLPPAMEPLRDGERVSLGGSVEDLQRYISLDSVSPLVLANLLGTGVRLTEELAPSATTMTVDQADALPESGYLWIAHEVIHYGSRQGNRLLDLERGLFVDLGFAVPEENYAEQALVLDYRCVLAAAWPFLGRSDGVGRRVPYAAVTELAEIANTGLGAFTQTEIDRFTAALCIEGMAERAATWGRPERIFDSLLPGISRSLRVKSALHLGAGSTVRLRDLSTGTVEYGLVMATRTERSTVDLLLPSVFRVELLRPVSQPFSGVDTVLEPLIPAPVNINTAPLPVLAAIFEQVRRQAEVRVHASDRQQAVPPRPISRSEARMLAEAIIAERAEGPGAQGRGPFTGWKDIVDRLILPRLDAAGDRDSKMRWVYFYRNLRTGRDAVIEMGTSPICFDSGPWVRYRAAASSKRSRIAPGIAARHERTGIAAAVPGFQLEHAWRTQAQFEEAFRLDRRSPFWVTTPINLGALPPNDLGNDPAGRYFPHILSHAFPELGFGESRYPSPDDVDAGSQPATSVAPYSYRGWARALLSGYDSFVQSTSPRGRDIAREGPYLMVNNGPADRGAAPQSTGGRHDRITFPFSGQFGFMAPMSTQFWLEPQSLEGVTLFDHSDGDPERNRMAVLGRDGQLVLELIDEAGLDPKPSDSPSGVERTALQLQVPLPEVGLPADTPIHVNVSAHSGRPSEIAMHLDGMPRGKSKFMTYLTGPIDAFDPSQVQRTNGSELPPALGNARYLDIQVEDTEGFPPVGVLRIGTELFEYSGISGNSFECQFRDSLGGRGSRQVGREHRPDIPVDSEGKPTVDINDLAAQGVSLDVFPQHPAGAKVELYGYSTPLSPDSPMMVGETTLGSAIGGFAVARAFLSSNPRPLGIALPQGGTFQVGEGIDENWTGDLELADPIQTGDQLPAAAQANITDAFPATGGYAMIFQFQFGFDFTQGNQTGSGNTGGLEIIKFDSREGNRLRNVQRAQQIPGDDRSTPTADYDGTARRFVTKWRPGLLWDPPAVQPEFHDVTRGIVWVVPISIPVASTSTLWDPQTTKLTEWVQLYPKTGDPNDTEWVRYDAIVGQHILRGNRFAWERTRFELTRHVGIFRVSVSQNGNTSGPGAYQDPWGSVQKTSGYIGYIPEVEANYPQIFRARAQLGFRGDMMREFQQEGVAHPSSHAHSNSIVTQCQRLSNNWGNYSAFSGRPGRNDRVALVQGSAASGSKRPIVEWHTVNWTARRFGSDNLSSNNNPPELLGPWPFQLVAFTDGVRGAFIGPPTGQQNYQDPRSYDRMVKFPSGELPSAWCENVHVGSGVGNDSPVSGFVDEVQVVLHNLPPLVVEEAFTADANTFRVHLNLTYDPSAVIWWPNNQTADYPNNGGLIQVDGEIIAYRELRDGEFTVAVNGRGMLGTESRDHDRGSHVTFCTNRPVAILSGGVAGRDDVLPLQSLGALPQGGGTVRLGRELLHYSWVRTSGDNVQLEMPRWYPPGQSGTSTLARGLFRGRFGTAPSQGSGGEAVIAWPFRYWDRHAELSDDPELAYSQLTSTSAPSFFRSLTWREEVRDSNVDVICLVRTDGRAPWTADPATTPGLWEFTRNGDDEQPRVLSAQGSRLEIRFSTLYKSGAIDLETMRAHGWKTSAKVSRVRVEYDGEPRIFDERVTNQ